MKPELSTKGFESFLEDRHMEQEPHLLDDDLSDAFDEWLSEQDAVTITAYVGIYAHQQGQLLAEAYLKEQGICTNKNT